jgi:hypothetical protein
MASGPQGLVDIIEGDLAERWKGSEGRLSRFLTSVGLGEREHSQALHVAQRLRSNPSQYLRELSAALLVVDGHWASGSYVSGDPDKPDETLVLAFPVNKKVRTAGSEQAFYLALYIEIHSRSVSWWLVNAWRSKQLADATWHLFNSMQLIPAAACARSLVETTASFWLDLKRMRE